MTTTQKPIIGVLASQIVSDLDVLDKVATSYTDAIIQYGGLPVIMPNDKNLIEEYSKVIDGVVLIGGMNDVDPELYGQENTHSNEVNTEKDEIELAWIEHAFENKIPLLGICRGMQLMNIFMGGTLVQNIESKIKHMDYQNQSKEIHSVQIVGSHYFDDGKYEINSVHHQGVEKYRRFFSCYRNCK